MCTCVCGGGPLRESGSFQSMTLDHQQQPGNVLKMHVLRLTPDLRRNLGGEPRGLAFNKRGDSNALRCAQALRRVRLWAAPRPVARQAPLRSVGFSRPAAWSGLPFPLLSSSGALKCGIAETRASLRSRGGPVGPAGAQRPGGARPKRKL